MKWFKREQASQVEIQQVVSTPTIIKESAVALPDFLSDANWEHRYLVEREIGADHTNPVSYFHEPFREALFDAGFIWIVKADFVRRFRYAAGIGSGVVSIDPSLPFITGISYVGDIPAFALDRMMEAKELGITQFSVHSAEPLKVERHRYVDPVMIGWYDRPAIQVKDDGGFVRCSDYCMGVVVAIWNGEKEISVLG